MNNQPNHEAGADAAAFDFKGVNVTYPRLRVRRNARGAYDAYLIRTPLAREIWVASGASAAEARAWLPERVEGA